MVIKELEGDLARVVRRLFYLHLYALADGADLYLLYCPEGS